MKFSKTNLPDVILIEPEVFGDNRGFFMETYHQSKFAAFGIDVSFVQENHTRSVKNTLRGLHFQKGEFSQGKLVRLIFGEVFDVVVDCRKTSPTFGKWTGLNLSDKNRLQLYVPPGFAHGFCVVSEIAEVVYLCSKLYSPENEGGILWSDPTLKVLWPTKEPIISEKDQKLPLFDSLNFF